MTPHTDRLVILTLHENDSNSFANWHHPRKRGKRL